VIGLPVCLSTEPVWSIHKEQNTHQWGTCSFTLVKKKWNIKRRLEISSLRRYDLSDIFVYIPPSVPFRINFWRMAPNIALNSFMHIEMLTQFVI
jgi:hypothetical protein